MVTTEQTTDEKKNQKTNDVNTQYGKCRWSDEWMIDKKGSNCPEYLFMSIFMKGLFK